MRQSALRWWLWVSLSLCAGTAWLCTSSDVTAQTWRGVYCLWGDHQIRPTRVVASGHILAGETINLIIPPPTYPNSEQYVALSWPAQLSCTWRVVRASGSYRMEAPVHGATLWEWQIVEVDVRTVDALNPQPRETTLRELPIAGSVQYSLNWSLNSEIIRWALMIMLGSYLAWWWIRAILDIVARWRDSPDDGDREWGQYNAEGGIAYDEEAGEYSRADRV